MIRKRNGKIGVQAKLDKIIDLGITKFPGQITIITKLAIRLSPKGNIVNNFIGLTRDPPLAPIYSDRQKSSRSSVEIRHNGAGVALQTATSVTTRVPTFEWISPPC
jgi:hypothetical protein